MYNHLGDLFRENRFTARTLFMIYGGNDSKRVVDDVPKFFNLIKKKTSHKLLSTMIVLENEGHVPPTSLGLGLVAIFEQ